MNIGTNAFKISLLQKQPKTSNYYSQKNRRKKNSQYVIGIPITKTEIIQTQFIPQNAYILVLVAAALICPIYEGFATATKPYLYFLDD